MKREILRHPDFGEIEAVVENGEWWFFGRNIARIKYDRSDNPSLGGNDYTHTKGHRKKFPRMSKDGNGANGLYISLGGIREIARHGKGGAKRRITELLRWLYEIIKEGELQTLFSKIPPFAPKEPCIDGEKKSNIYDCIEATRNDLTGKMSELQGIFDIMLAKWKNCVDAGLIYKSERDSAKADPQKVKSLELENARLKVLVGFRDILTRKFAGTYKNVGNEFEIKNEPLHEPLEIANYFGTTSQEVNVWLMEHGLQEKVENPSWGEAKYRPLPTPLGSQLAEVVYREEDGKKYHHLQWTTFGVSYIIGSMIFEKEKWDDIE